MMTMIQIIDKEEIERRHFLALNEEMIFHKERLLHEETMIRRQKEIEKEAFVMVISTG